LPSAAVERGPQRVRVDQVSLVRRTDGTFQLVASRARCDVDQRPYWGCHANPSLDSQVAGIEGSAMEADSRLAGMAMDGDGDVDITGKLGQEAPELRGAPMAQRCALLSREHRAVISPPVFGEL
jgi:hypothetical protein